MSVLSFGSAWPSRSPIVPINPGYGLVQTVPPAVEPITLTQAKLFLRVDVTDDDALITGLITAARQWVENYTLRALCTQTWVLTIDTFPDGWFSNPFMERSGMRGGVVFLPRPPLQAVSGITYVDAAGNVQTLASNFYRVQSSSEKARITPAYGQVWPATLPEIEAVAITYTAGYGLAAAVPPAITTAIYLLLATWYTTRTAIAPGLVMPVPFGVEAILSAYWTGERE